MGAQQDAAADERPMRRSRLSGKDVGQAPASGLLVAFSVPGCYFAFPVATRRT